MRKIFGRTLAATAATTAAAGLALLPAAPANAGVYYGLVASVQHENCRGELYGQQADGGANQVLAQWKVVNYQGTYFCHGWLDVSYDGGRTWDGLVNYVPFSYYSPNSTSWRSNLMKWTRVCVQKDGMAPAQCSRWW